MLQGGLSGRLVDMVLGLHTRIKNKVSRSTGVIVWSV